jgi:hypothetical protein
MSIATELQQILDDRAALIVATGQPEESLTAQTGYVTTYTGDIHDAIEAKGVTVNEKLKDFAGAIASITGGGATPETITGTAHLSISRTDSIASYSLTPSIGWGGDPRFIFSDNDPQTYGCNRYGLGALLSSHFTGGEAIPLGAVITKWRLVGEFNRSSSLHTYKPMIAGHGFTGSGGYWRGNDFGFASDGVRHLASVEFTSNPDASPITAKMFNDATMSIGFEINSPNYTYVYASEMYIEIDWTYDKLAQEIEATGVVTSQVSFDDGALKKGSQFIVIDNGDGTLSMPNRNLMIAKPFNMIDGVDGAVNAQNTATLVNTTNYGTISLNTEYLVGMIGGVSPVSNYVPDYWNPPYNIDQLFRDAEGVVWKSTINSNYSNPYINPTNDPSWMGWEQVKSHSNIYVCKTQHTTAAEPPFWNWGGQSYLVGDTITWSGMGVQYYECNTPYTSNGEFWNETANWTDVTDELIASAFESTKWVEVTNIATPMHLNKPMAFNFEDACAFANGLTFAGHTDWRLANIREIMDMMYFNNVASETSYPLAIPNLGLVAAQTFFRSSTPYSVDATNKALVTDFSTYSSVAPGYNSAQAYAMIVRDIA